MNTFVNDKTIVAVTTAMGQRNPTPEFLTQLFIAVIGGNCANPDVSRSSEIINEAFKVVADFLDLVISIDTPTRPAIRK